MGLHDREWMRRENVSSIRRPNPWNEPQPKRHSTPALMLAFFVGVATGVAGLYLALVYRLF